MIVQLSRNIRGEEDTIRTLVSRCGPNKGLTFFEDGLEIHCSESVAAKVVGILVEKGYLPIPLTLDS